MMSERPQSVRVYNRQPVDDIAEMPSLYAQKRFKPIHTLWAIVATLLLQVTLVLIVFLVPYSCSTVSCPMPSAVTMTSLMAYVQVVVWLLVMLLHLYIRSQHHISRRHGYGVFYYRTLCLRRVTFYIASIATILLLSSLLLFDDIDCNKNSCWLSPVHWIQLLVSTEVATCFIVLTVYLVHTVLFVRQHVPPDIFRESLLITDSASSRVFLGYRDHSVVDELLERQQDSITYLTERCQHLTHLLMLMQPAAGLDTSPASSTNDLSVSIMSSTAALTD